MNEFFEKILTIDRRYIFILIGLGVIIPLIVKIGLPITPSRPVRNVYEGVEELEPGSAVICSMDYDPATLPEMDPMARAFIRHCFMNDIKIIALTLHPAGAGVAELALTEISEEMGKEYGVDWTFLGYKVGTTAVILSLGENFRSAFPQDYYGTPVDDIPMMEGMQNYEDVEFAISFSGTRIPEYWVAYAHQRYHVKLASGVTAVMAADFYTYLDTGQMFGLIGGLKGAAEYETLINHPSKATKGMDAQSLIHVIIIIFIIIGNIAYFTTLRKKKPGGEL